MKHTCKPWSHVFFSSLSIVRPLNFPICFIRSDFKNLVDCCVSVNVQLLALFCLSDFYHFFTMKYETDCGLSALNLHFFSTSLAFLFFLYGHDQSANCFYLILWIWLFITCSNLHSCLSPIQIHTWNSIGCFFHFSPRYYIYIDMAKFQADTTNHCSLEFIGPIKNLVNTRC